MKHDSAGIVDRRRVSPHRAFSVRLMVLAVLSVALVAGAVPLAPVPAAQAHTFLAVSSPFVSNPTAGVWYRIPAAILNAQGHVLVFAERRDNNKVDTGDFEIVMRRSTDRGRTWGPIKVVADMGRYRVSNPVPILDPKTGDVLLVTSIRDDRDTTRDAYKGIYLQRSTDGGQTWSSLSSGRIRPQGDFKGGLTGPGHGIVLQHGEHAGRILLAMGYRKPTYYGAYGIYSDDGGLTWNVGYDRADTSGTIAYIEGTLAELPDGRVYINYRDKRGKTPGTSRLSAISSDGGKTLSTGFRRVASLKMHSVEGSALSPDGKHSGLLLFSGPTYIATTDRSLRREMGLFVSRDGGATFGRPYPVELVNKPGSYSDLVQIDETTAGIAFETGTRTWRERIRFMQLCLDDVAAPVKRASSVSGSLSSTRVSRFRRASVRAVVKVRACSAPSGRVLVRYKGLRKSGTTTAQLTYTSKGVRTVVLPRLPRGSYRIWVTYRGNARIADSSDYVGRLSVR